MTAPHDTVPCLPPIDAISSRKVKLQRTVQETVNRLYDRCFRRSAVDIKPVATIEAFLVGFRPEISFTDAEVSAIADDIILAWRMEKAGMRRQVQVHLNHTAQRLSSYLFERE